MPGFTQADTKCQRRLEITEVNAVVAAYKTHVEAEVAVKKLQRGGIDMRTLSIVAKDTHSDEHVVGYYNTGDRMKYWGKTGAFGGGFWGLLFGSAFFAIPGIGPVLVAAPWLGGSWERWKAVGMGIPKDSVVQYEMAIKTDKFLLMVHGTATEVERARGIIEDTQPVEVTLHAAEVVGAAVALRP